MAAARHLLLKSKSGGGSGSSLPIPQGTIWGWSGLLVNIPVDFALCDGTGVTPNLVARFIKGAAAGVDPGLVGGSDTHGHTCTAAGTHTHTLSARTHQHTTNAAGDHAHDYSTNKGAGASTVGRHNTTGSHSHTTALDAGHTHTLATPGDHQHVINAIDGRPPYYEVAFIQATAGTNIPAGIIGIWAGTLITIPAGFTLCDGGGGRPDIRASFVRGVNTAITNPGTTGGATTHTHIYNNVAAHSHVCDAQGTHTHAHVAYTWTHDHGSFAMGTGSNDFQVVIYSGAHTHANTDNIGSHDHNAIGNGGAHLHIQNPASSLPAYYDVAMVYAAAGVTMPSGVISIWTGLLANIPSGWSLCDGGGGRPDLRAKYVRGSAVGVDPGGTGGSNTHSHTDQNGGAHTDHAQTAAGAHQHAATNTIGSHRHGTLSTGSNAASGATAVTAAEDFAGDHSHTFNNEGAHTHASVSNPGDHAHGTSTDNGEPAYYEVAFISKN